MPSKPTFRFAPLGDTAVRIELGNKVSPDVNQLVRSLCHLLNKKKIPGVVEWIPAYTAVTVFYDPYKLTYVQIIDILENIRAQMTRVSLPASRLIHIPVCYGQERGPDLTCVAQYNSLTEEEVIQIHSGPEYLIYMMGFSPGFPYLGGMSKKIATPRLSKPRDHIPPGSVGIAGEQTGIYPMGTPGGWQLIGRTPVRLYDPDREFPMLFQAGDYLKFVPVSQDQYKEMDNQVKAGTYSLKILEKQGDEKW